MPTEHGDGHATCRQEGSSQRRQPSSFLPRSGGHARRRLSPDPCFAQTQAKDREPLPTTARRSPRTIFSSSSHLRVAVTPLCACFPHRPAFRYQSSSAVCLPRRPPFPILSSPIPFPCIRDQTHVVPLLNRTQVRAAGRARPGSIARLQRWATWKQKTCSNCRGAAVFL